MLWWTVWSLVDSALGGSIPHCGNDRLGCVDYMLLDLSTTCVMTGSRADIGSFLTYRNLPP